MSKAEDLRQAILAQVAEYYQEAHADRPFIPGETKVNYAGRVYDAQEMQQMVDAVLGRMPSSLSRNWAASCACAR